MPLRVVAPLHSRDSISLFFQSECISTDVSAPTLISSKPANLLGGSAVFWTAPRTGPAENADSFHAGILNLDSTSGGRPSSGSPRMAGGWIGIQTPINE